MVIHIPSAGRRFRLKIIVRAIEPFSLIVRGYDQAVPNTFYFRRRIPFKAAGIREIDIPLPLSPNILSLHFADEQKNNEKLKVEGIRAEPMPPARVWEEEVMHAYIRFALNFSEQAGHLGTGFYTSPDERFLFQYLPYINDGFGKELVTPARTNRYTGRIQVSQAQFIRFTIPVRFFILLHERYHYQIPTRQEKPADLNALRVYLDLGFPQTEALYALSKVFLSHPDTVGKAHGQRVKDVINFIDRYRLSNNEQIAKAA